MNLYIARDGEGFDVASLRQGDILEGVPFPLMDHTQIQLLGVIAPDQDFQAIPALSPTLREHREDREWMTAVAPVRFGFCAVLSNCCDLEPRQGRVQAPAVVLARLQSIPNDLRRNPAFFKTLRANKDPRDPTGPGYIDFFYLEPHDILGQRDWRVAFNQVVSLPTSDIALLLRKKVLQLDDRTRGKFKIKLGFKFMRPNDEEREVGLDNPWAADPPAQGDGHL